MVCGLKRSSEVCGLERLGFQWELISSDGERFQLEFASLLTLIVPLGWFDLYGTLAKLGQES